MTDQRPTRGARVLTQESDGTIVLLDPDGGRYFALDEVGGRVWQLCDGTRSVAEVVAALCDEFDAPPDAIEADVHALLDELRRERLLAGA